MLKIDVDFSVFKEFSCSAVLLFWLLILLGFTEVSAQTQTSRPERGTGGKGTQAVSEIDSVNLQNGNVSLSIPLASLPSIAGGKLSYGLNIYYNSKLWNAFRSEVYGTTSNPGCQPTYNTEELVYEGGWQIGGGYVIYFRDAREDFNYLAANSEACYGYEFYYMQGKFFKPMLRMPDGSEHEMRIAGNYETYSLQGSRDHLRNYYRYNGVSPAPSFDTPTRLYTVDGTFITAVVNPPSYTVKSVIYLKDGTRVETTADGQRIFDNNGNSIHLGQNTVQGYNFAKDEGTGREIKWSDAVYNGQNATKIEYQSVGGTWQTVWVVWGTTVVQGKLYSRQSWNPNGGETGGGASCYLHDTFTDYLNVVREIILPATEQNAAPQKYTFAYNSDTTVQATTNNVRWACGQPTQTYTRTASYGTGELSQITTPTGAQIKYTYWNDNKHNIGQLFESSIDEFVRNVITKKDVIHDGVTDTWNYQIDTTTFAGSGGVTNPDGSFYYENFFVTNPLLTGAGSGFGGLTYRTVQSGKVMTEKSWELLGGVLMAFGSVDQRVSYNPVVTTEYTSLLDDQGNRLKISARKFQYDYNGELLQIIEYDWFDPSSVTFTNNFPQGIPVSATVLRVTDNSYYNQASNVNDPNAYQQRPLGSGATAILGALKETKTGNGTVDKSITRFSYDGLAYNTAPTKGNLTKASAWLDTTNQFVDSLIGYDAYGNVISKTDPKGNVTQIFYEDATHALPTKTIVDPLNGTGQQISTATYDFYTGLPLTSTDINGNASSIDYTNHLLGTVDPFGRPGTTYSPYIQIDGVNKRLSSKTYYEDAARKTRVESDLFNEGDALLKVRETRDQMGRTVLTEKNENGANAYTISSQTVYKTQERVVLSSNPARGDNAPTDGWTRVTSDILGRAIEAATFSGTAMPPVTGGFNLSTFTGKVITGYSANVTTVTDQAGKQRRSVVNSLGQLTRVDEPNDAGALDAGGVPVQPTNYQYDVLGNLTQVQQIGTTTGQCGGNAPNCTQTRTFVYDSLSRLKQATNPEAGTISYNYDLNGNLKTKTDARGIRTIYEYDGLNRPIKRCYTIPNPSGNPTACNELTTTTVSQNTLPVNYTYDNLPNAKGRLTKVVTGDISAPFSVMDYQAFDKFGRVTQSLQTTDGMTASANYVPMTYKYNLSGALIEQTYPSGRVVKNVLDNDGDLAMVHSKRNADAGFWNYAKHFTYTAAGAVASMQYGNSKWESTVFNVRLQPTQIALGSTQNATDNLKLNFDYGQANNNGNVLSQTITVPTVGSNQGFTAVQTYSYDSLNRIKDAKEMIGTSQQWKQTFQYDRYGNRRFDTANNNTTTLQANCPTAVCNPQVDPATNKLIGYTFDNAGNTKIDAENRQFIYDGENKQVEVKDSQNNTIGKYSYDGDGKRVKKVSATETTIFIYDASGKMVAEYSTAVVSQQDAKVSYLTNDHLGSPRITTDQNGQVVSRRDFQPFGEEIQRANYGTDTVRQKFTSYERDIENDLDFAQARYYNSRHGRFTSIDPENAGADESDPQSWNGYAYVRNNPVILVDPNGLDYKVCYSNGQCFNYTNKEFANYTNSLPDGFSATGSKKNGSIIDPDGNNLASYTYFTTADQDAVAALTRDENRTLEIWGPVIRFAGNHILPFFALPGGGGAVTDYLASTVAREAATELAPRILPRAVPAILQKLCFVAGTPILTENGLKPIEEIKEGDKVLSYNEKTKRNEYKTVVQTIVREAKAEQLLSVQVEGEAEPLGVTNTHPFYARVHKARDNTASGDDEGEWIEAGKLQIGDEIRKADGNWASVQSITQQTKGAKVYNFEVADNHNYFVGQTSLLAHNDCIPKVSNSKLANIIRDLYKGANTAKPIGTGSTADAVRYELQTGTSVGGKFHSQKAGEYIKALEKWLQKNPGADSRDQMVARSVLQDLKSALAGN